MVWRCKPLTTKRTTDRTLVLIQGGMGIGGVKIPSGMTAGARATARKKRPLVLSVQAGDVVIVWASQEAKSTQSKDWWMGEVLRVETEPMDGEPSPLLQVADVETGMVCLVECDQVQRVRIPIHAPLTTK